MSYKRLVAFSFLITVVVWAIFSWPLPRYVADGIPASSTNVERNSVRRMIEGDHLQLLYNYWIFADMLQGKTPFWHNIYEFNTGDDADRKYVGPDLLPFSLIFTVGYMLGGRALGWNMLGLFSLWVSYFFCWLLVRRYTKNELSAALGSLLILFLPYRWVSLMGGSPTGLAMALVPMLYFGLDLAVRDKRMIGGVLAGLAILFAAWNDSHVFLVGFLSAPCWCLLAFLCDRQKKWLDWRTYGQIIKAMLPFILLAGIPILLSMNAVSEGVLDETNMEQGRSLHEVSLFSPNPSGYFDWIAMGHENSIYIGWLLLVLIGIGFVLLLKAFVSNPDKEQTPMLAFVVLLVGGACILLLAPGVNGFCDGWLFLRVRNYVPYYNLIRQTAKIMAILPPILAVLVGLSVVQILNVLHGKKIGRMIVVVYVCIMGITYALQVRTTVCLLDRKQGAYAAVAADAIAHSEDPRALIIPLWPGDSAWSSLYEHYVSLYRIRMLNGYLPLVPNSYVNITTFHEFANVGIFPSAQLDDLERRGIHYVIFHEDAFPEQVSNFPAAFTLYNLLRHPRLQWLAQDGNVWAFRIRPQAEEPVPVEALASWTVFFPTHNSFWEAEWGQSHPALSLVDDPDASGGKAVRLTDSKCLMLFNVPHCNAPQTELLVRLKGNGTLNVEVILDNGDTNRVERRIQTKGWRWFQIPVGPLGVSGMMQPVFSVTNGSLDVDAVMAFAGKIPELSVGETWRIPAPLFFHAGYTDLAQNSVVLRPDYQSDGGRWGVFYGPKLPIAAGEYRVTFHFDSVAPIGTMLGSFYVSEGDVETKDYPVHAGQLAAGAFVSRGASPINIHFTYSRAAEMAIHYVDITREDQGGDE